MKKVQQFVSLAEKSDLDDAGECYDESDDAITPCVEDEATAERQSGVLQLMNFEYHLLYHISYGVPYLAFNAYKSSELEAIFRARPNLASSYLFIYFFH